MPTRSSRRSFLAAKLATALFATGSRTSFAVDAADAPLRPVRFGVST